MIMNYKGLLIITLRIDFFLEGEVFCDNLGEDNITEVQFEELKKDVPVEIEIYIRNHVVEA